MNKEMQIRWLEERHLVVINSLDKIRCPQNWTTDPDKVEASLELIIEEAIILAEIARLKQSFPHMTAALECLREAKSVADQHVVESISKQAIVASLRYSKYVDRDLDLGKFDTPFARFATILQSIGQIVRIRLEID